MINVLENGEPVDRSVIILRKTCNWYLHFSISRVIAFLTSVVIHRGPQSCSMVIEKAMEHRQREFFMTWKKIVLSFWQLSNSFKK